MARFGQKKAERQEKVSSTPVLSWDWCFAKSTENGEPRIPVFDHCKIAGSIANQLSLLQNLHGLLPFGMPFLVATHDVGKVSPGFLKHCSNKALESLHPELAAANMEARGWEKNHACANDQIMRPIFS